MNPQIERLTPDSLRDMEEIGTLFATSVGYPGGFNLAAFEEMWTPILSHDFGVVFAIRAGSRIVAALGASYMKDPFSGVRLAAEAFWFVLPEFRGARLAEQLFGAFEFEGVARGCTRFVMVRLEGEFADALDRLYEKRGYRPFEKTFTKEIS